MTLPRSLSTPILLKITGILYVFSNSRENGWSTLFIYGNMIRIQWFNLKNKILFHNDKSINVGRIGRRYRQYSALALPANRCNVIPELLPNEYLDRKYFGLLFNRDLLGALACN